MIDVKGGDDALIRFKHKGGFQHTERFFQRASERSYLHTLQKYGQAGVEALASATPTKSGTTAVSWNYEIVPTDRGCSIFWTNSNTQDGVNIAVILQYGHGTGTGGYVRGIDYITPAIRPIFEQIANEAWKEAAGT